MGFSKHWKQGTRGAVPWNILKQGGMEGGVAYIGTWNTGNKGARRWGAGLSGEADAGSGR